MRIYHSLIMCWLAMGLLSVPAQSGGGEAGELYFKGYMLKNEAEKLEQGGDLRGAYAKYEESRGLVANVAQNFPQWQPEVVTYRLKAIELSLQQISSKLGGALPVASSPATASSAGKSSASAPTTSAPAASSQSSANLEAVTKQYLDLQRQNSEMAAQIKAYDSSYKTTLEEKNRAQQEKLLLERQMKDLNERVESLSGESKSRDTTGKAEVEKARNESKMVSELLSKTTAQLTESTKVMDNLLKEKETLQANQQRLEGEIEIIKKDKPEEFKKLLADKDAAQKKLEAELAEARQGAQDVMDMRKAVAEKEAAQNKLHEEIETLKVELNTAKSGSAMSTQLKKTVAEKEALQRQLESEVADAKLKARETEDLKKTMADKDEA
ncbi:MAG TPA: hypothetical protein VK956_01520, partial [Verrucomicrobium sp.]|nr:hypothetical protein [Verrucomicrobium sp.]